MARSKGSRAREQRKRIIFLGIVLASIAVMGGVVYFAYSSFTQPTVYRMAFQLQIIIGNPDNNQTKFATIPANIGVEPALWNFHGLDGYGVGNRAPIYTLDDTGIVRVQSTVQLNYTLGNLFTIWGRLFNSTCVQVDQLYCSNVGNSMFLGLLVRHASDSSFSLNSDYELYQVRNRDSIRITYLQTNL